MALTVSEAARLLSGNGNGNGNGHKKPKRASKPRAPKPLGPPDEDAATELELWVDNTEPLYRSKHRDLFSNLAKKKASGKYDRSKAPKLFGYLAERAAKDYAKNFSTEKDWSTIFSKATRHHVAKGWVDEFEAAWATGELYEQVPKKYRKAGIPGYLGSAEQLDEETKRVKKARGGKPPEYGFTDFSSTMGEANLIASARVLFSYVLDNYLSYFEGIRETMVRSNTFSIDNAIKKYRRLVNEAARAYKTAHGRMTDKPASEKVRAKAAELLAHRAAEINRAERGN